MLIQLAELTVNKSADYYGEVVKALEKDGFTIVETLKTTLDTHYIVAREEIDYISTKEEKTDEQ